MCRPKVQVPNVTLSMMFAPGESCGESPGEPPWDSERLADTTFSMFHEFGEHKASNREVY